MEKSALLHIEKILDISHWELDILTNEVIISEGLHSLLDIPSGSDVDSKGMQKLFEERSAYPFSQYLKNARQGHRSDIDVEFTFSNKATKWIRTIISPVLGSNNEVTKVLCVVQNVTDRKKKAQELDENQKMLQHMAESIPGVVYQFKVKKDGTRSFVFVSKGSKAMFGLAPQEIISDFSFIWQKLHPKDRSSISESIYQKFQKEQTLQTEFRIINANKVKWILGSSEPDEPKPDGSITISGIFLDITARKTAEIELEHNSTLLEHVQRLSKMGIWRWRVSDNIIRWSDELHRIFGTTNNYYDNTLESYLRFVHPDDKAKTKKEILSAFLNRREFSFEGKIVRKNGEIRHLSTWGGVLSQNGEVFEMFGACMDVTDIIKADLEIRKTLREKEVLLQEVHHRVKNNLALISGLFELQAHYTTSDDAKNILIDSQLRVQSIAKIHEILYQSESLANISFDEYLNEIVTSIKNSTAPVNKQIHINLKVDEVELNVNQAIPCGMILNELSMNAFKHAFKNQNEGAVDITLKALPRQWIQLTISDNGVGIDEDINFEEPVTLGLLLVKTLIEQLNAKLDITSKKGKGTSFTLRFRKKQVKGSASKYI